MLILGPSNSCLKKLINIQKCPPSTKLDHCGVLWKSESYFLLTQTKCFPLHNLTFKRNQ